MTYILPIATMIVIFAVPTAIVCGLVAKPQQSPTNRPTETRSNGPQS
jgi:hypothetical protein